MKDTAPEMAALYRELLMERSNEERSSMGASMCQTARRIVWSSIPGHLPENERRLRFFRRYYGNDDTLDPRLREMVEQDLKRSAESQGNWM